MDSEGEVEAQGQVSAQLIAVLTSSSRGETLAECGGVTRARLCWQRLQRVRGALDVSSRARDGHIVQACGRDRVFDDVGAVARLGDDTMHARGAGARLGADQCDVKVVAAH